MLKTILVPKDAEMERFLRTQLEGHFLFAQADATALDAVVDMMEPFPLRKGQVIIKQGGWGDFFYLLEEGSAVAIVDGVQVKEYTHHHEDKEMTCFGELALLYNRPRSADVVATSGGQAWRLGRQAFRSVLAATLPAALSSAPRGATPIPTVGSLGQALQYIRQNVPVIVSHCGGTVTVPTNSKMTVRADQHDCIVNFFPKDCSFAKLVSEVYARPVHHVLSFSGGYKSSTLHLDLDDTASGYYMKEGMKRVIIVPSEYGAAIPSTFAESNLKASIDPSHITDLELYMAYYYESTLQTGDMLFFNNTGCYHLFENLTGGEVAFSTAVQCPSEHVCPFTKEIKNHKQNRFSKL